ncbi:hypothetical protein CLOM_g4585 [Closterium sp. NIES-68]|nr:hypothetical protein CLOM_g4585 [Closterium sp. NIES-68]GJP74906.1 hypothetical protein CLOP_g5429 [Closterium sp. NIES-67]
MAASDFQRRTPWRVPRAPSQDSAECTGSAFLLSPHAPPSPQIPLSPHFPLSPHVPLSPLPPPNPTPRSHSCPIDHADPIYASPAALTRSASARSGAELSRRADFPRGATAAALPLPPLECAPAKAASAAGSSLSADTMSGGVCAPQVTRSYSAPLHSNESGSGGGGGGGRTGNDGARGEQRSLRQSARAFDPSVLPRLSQPRARSGFEAERPYVAENYRPSPTVLFDGRPPSPAFALPPPPLAESPTVSAPNTPAAAEYPTQSAARPGQLLASQQQSRAALKSPVPASPLSRQLRVSEGVVPRPPTPAGNGVAGVIRS